MRLNKIIFIILIIFISLTFSCVCAEELDSNETVALQTTDDVVISASSHEIYVDDTSGDDLNDGMSWNSSVKSFNHALDLAEDNSTIYIADGDYKGEDNTKITIDKSLVIVGSSNTNFDGENINSIFTVADNVTIVFKNINFINAFKNPVKFSDESAYGAGLDIKNAKVTVDNCSFINNVISYESTVNRYIYGGAISNFGDLTIINSYFLKNSLIATSGLFGYGGSIYNKGKLLVNNSTFDKSGSNDFGYGSAIANEGELVMNNSIISNSVALQECKGSAIFNTGNLTLLNSVIENNTISRSNFYFIFGAIYNTGDFKACGNIFRKNSAVYLQSMNYRGSPNIYNIGNLDLTYNAFIDNAPFSGISQDVYYNGGDIINLDNNWWQTNGNPFKDNSRVNVDEVHSWFVFNLNPDYSKLNISDSVEIKGFWSLNNDNKVPNINLFPLFNVTFTTTVNGDEITYNELLSDGNSIFLFNYTQIKGQYNLISDVEGFKQNVTIDVGKIESYIKFNGTTNITYMDALKIDVEVITEDNNVPTGNVTVLIGDDSYTLSLIDGKASLELSNLNPQAYAVKFTYEGNENYFKAFNSTTVTIRKSPVDLNVSSSEIYVGEKGSILVSLGPKGAQGQAILYVNGVRNKIVYLYNGNTTIALNNFAEGEYNITIGYRGSNVYESANASCIFKVKRYETSLNVTADDINVGQNATIKIVVSPENLRGNAILSINGVNNTIFLENSTTYINLYSLGAGTYDVCVIYLGDKMYASCNDTTSFKVSKAQSNITVQIIQNDDDLNGTVIVNSIPSNCTGIVGVYINYKLYELNLTDGTAKFDVEFDKGTNYIFVYYVGDEFYEPSTWNTTIGVADEFILIGQNVTAFEFNTFNYTVHLIEYNGIPMPGRIVTVRLDEREYNLTTNDDGVVNLSLTLPKGSYAISVTYLNETVYNTIEIKEIMFNLTSANITYGDNEIIEAVFNKNVTGRVHFVIEGILDVFADIIDGKASYNLTLLNVGNYTVSATYSNDLFNSSAVDDKFSVVKADFDFNVEIPPVSPGDTQSIIIEAPVNSTGFVKITVDDDDYDVEIKNNRAVLNISDIAEGFHDVKISYEGDNNYNSNSLITSFYVKEFSTDVILTVGDEEYGKWVTAVAKVNQTATGNITFKVGNMVHDVEINDGIASWTFKGLDAGKYSIEAFYSGNTNFRNSSNSTSFEILKANSTIELFTLGVYLNENIKIYANLSENATGYVTFSMIGYYSPRNKEIEDSMSLWYIEPLNTGKYTVLASYAGDKNYYASNTTFILDISQKRAVLNVEIADVGINDVVMVKAKLNSIDGSPLTSRIKITIASRSYTFYVVNGEGSLNLGKLNSGNYTFTAEYDGSDEFSKAVSSGSFKVIDNLLDVSLTANDLTKYYKGSEKLTATLTYSNKAISNAKITVAICSSKYTLTTNDKGEAALPINLKPGKYNAEIVFEETSTYKSAKVKVVVTVLSTVEGIDVVKIYGSSDQYYATFVDSSGKALGNTNVKFTISGKFYTVKTLPNGIARINVNFKAGKYTITATNPVTGESKSNSITIVYRLSENKDLTKYFGASNAYKVRAFNDNGKAVGAGEIVKITVCGKTYTVKTDKNGYATLPINLNPKTYTITAVYKGFKVSNKIVVKPVLTASNLSKKVSKTTSFSAKLVNTNGKPLAGKKITFKIKGKTFSATTNSKGVATVKINIALGVGKYSIVSSYGKSTITNTITVKK